MQNYILSCCTTVDMDKEWEKENQIVCVPFYFEIGKQKYKEDFWSSMKPAEVYGRLLEGEQPHTSHAPVEEYTEHFRSFLAKGKDVLHVSLSSGISEAYNTAVEAAEKLKEEFPDRRLIVVDSMAASSGYGLLMTKLARLRS